MRRAVPVGLSAALLAVLLALAGPSLHASQVEGPEEAQDPNQPATGEATGSRTAFPREARESVVRITRILVDGHRRLSPDAIRHIMATKEGDPYDEALLREDFRRVWARGLLSDLSIESRDDDGGKAIIIHVEEKPVVNDVTYDQSKVVGQSAIEEALKERDSIIDIGEPVDYGEIKKAEETIKTIMGQKGYLDGKVESKLTDAAVPGSLNVHFEIEEGPKTRIKKIEFTGNSVFSDRKLRKSLKLTKEKGLFTRMSGKDVYHPIKFDQDVREVETLYQNVGYIDVQLPPPEVTVVEERASEKPGKSRKWVHVRQQVIEGEQYKLGKIEVSGNTLFDDDYIRSRIPLREGMVLNNAFLQAGLDLVEADYGKKGYLYISTNRIIDRKGDSVADITIRISEDQPYKVGRIDFSGNTVTRDRVLRREMRVEEGDLLDIQRLRLGLRRVNQLGFFQIQKEPVIEPVEGTDQVKVRIEGIEQRRSELQVGGGYSGLDGGFFTANYQTRNFLGRGNLVTFNAQAGSISTRYVLSFTEPYFLGKPILLGFSLFRRTTDFTDFDTDSGGTTVTLGYRFKVFHSVSTTYLYEEVDFDPVTGLTSETRTSSIRPLYTYNTINNIFRPSRGLLVRASMEYAGGFLGGDNWFIKPIVEATKFLKGWKRTFWALHGEMGYVSSFGDERTLPTFERYFLGGERSLRIFETRSVAPIGYLSRFYRDTVVFHPDDCPEAPGGERHSRQARCDAFEAGGNKMFLVNLEYVFPTQGPVDLALFLDAGNVFIDDENINLSKLKKDAGIELRFFLPVFGAPLRLIYGYNLDPEEGEDKSQFVFSVGTTF